MQNSSDAEKDPLSISNLKLIKGDGKLIDSTNAGWIFTPDKDFHGDVEISYLVNDGDNTRKAESKQFNKAFFRVNSPDNRDYRKQIHRDETSFYTPSFRDWGHIVDSVIDDNQLVDTKQLNISAYAYQFNTPFSATAIATDNATIKFTGSQAAFKAKSKGKRSYSYGISNGSKIIIES